jgi:hypothetical protein
MGDLKLGEILLLSNGDFAEVAELRFARATEGEMFTTYNFAVEGSHTYFVAANGDARWLWVHNCPVEVGDRPRSFRPTTREFLKENYPWAFNRQGQIKYTWRKSEEGNWYKHYTYNVRHVVPSAAIIAFIEDLMTELGTRTLQRRVLARMLKVPVSRVSSVRRAARELYLRLYNNPRNLFLGLAEENQELGREMVGAVRALNLADAPLLDLPKYMEYLLDN